MIKNFTKAIFGVLIAGVTPAMAQQYQVALDAANGDDYVNKILIDGNSVIGVGSTNATGAGAYDMLITEGNLNDGSFSNENQVGNTGNETARAVGKLTSGDVVVAGASNSYAPFSSFDDLMVLAFNGNGPVWAEVLGTDSVDRAFSVKASNDGNVILAGQNGRSFGNSVKSDGLVVKLNAQTGAVIWAQIVGTSYTNEVTYDVFPINGVGYLVVGYSGVNVIGLNDAMVVLLNEDGTKNTAFIFGTSSDDDVRSFIPAGPGLFYLAGNTRPSTPGNGDMFLAGFNAVNFPVITMDWFKTYGGSGSESFSSACFNPNNNGAVLVGSTQSFGTGGDAFAISVDNTGTIQWAKNYGGANADIFQNVAEDGSGGFVAAGFSNSFPNGPNQNDVWVVRMDANGESLCNQSNAAFTETTLSSSDAYAVFVDAALNDIVSTDTALVVRTSLVTVPPSLAINQNNFTPNVLCTTVSVQENSAADVVSIYPNPASDMLNFNFGVNAANAKGLIIYNALGAKVYETTLNTTTSIFSADLSNLSTGIYTAVVMMNDTQVTAKFTIAK